MRRYGPQYTTCSDGAVVEEVRRHSHVLTPTTIVGVEPQEDDGERFADRMRRRVIQLREQQAEAAGLDAAFAACLKALGYWGE